TGTRTPARRSTMPSSMSAHASRSAPACSSASATRSAPCPYALALTTAMMPGGVRPCPEPGRGAGSDARYCWMAAKLCRSALRSTRAMVLRIIQLVLATSREIRESRLLAEEGKAHDAGWTVALLGEDEFRRAGVWVIGIPV